MIKRLLIPVVLICLSGLMHAQTFTDHTYEYSDSVFNNPERGFYRYTERSNTTSSLSVNTLLSYREQGYTLIYRIFYMRDFVNTPISQAYLDKIREDFTHMRIAGIKGVIRFAYTSSQQEPYGDATPEQVNIHIAQLKPLLIENTDVIMVLQAGFIGAWGEWYYTDHFATGSPNNVTAEDLQERKTLVYNLLDALPKERMIQLRYVGYKRQLFDSIPVTKEEAYSGSPKSRISHHNDCFASSNNDVGSYHNIQYDKKYLEQDSKYTSIGGETCAWYEPRSNCDTSTYEMERFHWSFINIDYFGQTITNWKAGECFPEMQKRLGYRYFLIDSKLQNSSKHGSSATFSFTLENFGYSNPMNPRNVEIVLQNNETGKLYYSPVEVELRKYELNTSIDITAEIGIPSYLPNGAYSVYLNLPDPKPTLKHNPDFSIRLANNNVWNETLGMNSLHHTLLVDDNSTFGDTYTGQNFFLNYDGNSPDQTHITIDGNPADWNLMDTASTTDSNTMLKVVKLYDTGDTLFCLLKGNNLYPNTQIFIDTDPDGGTGMNYYTWSNDDGVDYLVQNNEVYSYHGSNGSSDWDWSLISSDQVSIMSNDTVVEIAIPTVLFGTPGPNDQIRLGALTLSADWSANESLPKIGDAMITYTLKPFIQTPHLYVTSYCNNNIISFAPEEQDSVSQFIIEKSSGDDNQFVSISVLSGLSPVNYFRDIELNENATNNYRIYRIKDDQSSRYSDAVSIQTGSECNFRYPVVNADGSENDWNAIPPLDAVSDGKNDFFFKVYCSNDFLNVLLLGDSVISAEIYIDTDNNPSTGATNGYWKNAGFEFKCVNDTLFKYGSGSFTQLSMIDAFEQNSHLMEFQVPLDLLSVDNSQDHLSFGVILHLANSQLLLPFKNRNRLEYERVLPALQPEDFAVRNSVTSPTSKLIATWSKCDNCDGYILTRTEKSSGTETEFDLSRNENQLIDEGLERASAYEYTVYSYNFAGKSPNAGPVELSTTTGIEELKNDDDIAVWPVPSSDELFVKFGPGNSGAVYLKIYTPDGKLVYARNIEISDLQGSRELSIPAAGIGNGVFFLQVNVRNKGVFVKKIIIE